MPNIIIITLLLCALQVLSFVKWAVIITYDPELKLKWFWVWAITSASLAFVIFKFEALYNLLG